MPLPPTASDRGDAGAAAVRQVLIARTRERLCEACSTAAPSDHPHPIALSLRVDGTDLFVITPDAVDLRTVGPAQTALADLRGRVLAAAWDGRTAPSSRTAAHAAAHSAEDDVAVASSATRIVRAPTPAAALLAVADPAGSPPADGTPPGSGTTLPAGKASDPHHHRRSTQ